MGIGPALPWGATRLEELQYRLLPPVAIGVALVILLLGIGIRGVGALVTFGAAAFVLAITAGRLITDVRVRRGNTQEPWGAAVYRLMAANPRRYGGYLVHVGVLLVVIGIAASQAYGARTVATLVPGRQMFVDGYTVTYRGLQPHGEPNRMVLGVRLSAARGGEELGEFIPSLNIYPGQQQPVVTPAIREEPLDMLLGIGSGRNPLPDLSQLAHGRNPFEDLYLVLQAVNPDAKHPERSTVQVEVLVNPMVGFIWLGGVVAGLGGLVALLPALRRRRATVAVEQPRSAVTEEVPA
jgi:cytochrome c-type biogenesis protein CcmF